MNIQRVSGDVNINTRHVTYVMSSSFRVLDNHSLYYAINMYETCDIVIYPTQTENIHNDYILSFIDDLAEKLTQFGHVKIINDIQDIVVENDVILDQGYLKEDRLLEKYIRNTSTFSVKVIESNVVVPVRIASNKEEYSARTIRPKIHKHLNSFLDPVLDKFDVSNQELIALRNTESFIKEKLEYYHLKNHPEFDYSSKLSVYLRFGIISPIRILILLNQYDNPNTDSFVEELVIRRELSYNFVFYNDGYDKFETMTYNWAYNTMKEHQYDQREYLYTVEDYINFRTHDKYFNSAMKEMVYLGKMHGYMRMYWCKKIIEWSSDYKTAYDIAINLNNKYFLDGCNPNGYAGVAWCFGKHDRAWGERPIFGKLRYMNINGLKRKFDIDKYCIRIENEVSQMSLGKKLH